MGQRRAIRIQGEDETGVVKLHELLALPVRLAGLGDNYDCIFLCRI